MDAKKIYEFLEKTLLCEFWQEPYGVNGLQVEGPSNIKKIIFAVDASLELFEKDADLFVVHHGIIWKKQGILTITDNYYKRASALIKENKGLFAVHLPLDYHIECGNTNQLCKLLNLKVLNRFDDFGLVGELKKNVSYEEFIKEVEIKLNSDVKHFKFSKKIEKIGVSCGAAASSIYAAINVGCDTFITGQQDHSIYHIAKEEKINLIFAGHYATETLGIISLMKLVKQKFPKIECVFEDIPTGL